MIEYKVFLKGALRALFIRHGMCKAIEMRAKSIPLFMQNLLNEFMAYCLDITWNRFVIFNESFIDFRMDDMISNANVYSAFLEGKATKDEMRTILNRLMCDSRLMMKLNLAATIRCKKKDEMIV